MSFWLVLLSPPKRRKGIEPDPFHRARLIGAANRVQDQLPGSPPTTTSSSPAPWSVGTWNFSPRISEPAV